MSQILGCAVYRLREEASKAAGTAVLLQTELMACQRDHASLVEEQTMLRNSQQNLQQSNDRLEHTLQFEQSLLCRLEIRCAANAEAISHSRNPPPCYVNGVHVITAILLHPEQPPSTKSRGGDSLLRCGIS